MSLSNVSNSNSVAMQSTAPSEHSILYKAQVKASEVFETTWFPCYSPEYIQAQEGFKGKVIWCYSKVYEGAAMVGGALHGVIAATQYVVLGIISIGHRVVGFIVDPIVDVVFPINPINGHRQFIGIIPRSVEKLLGDWIFYPLASGGMRKTNALLAGTTETIASRVKSVLDRLKGANGDLLNPPSETTQFNYRVKTVYSHQINAFACPAGGMVVYSQIVNEIDAAIKAKALTEATISFADGSTARVDLSNVQLDDVLAALMGHEMTHVASRHSMISMVIRFVQNALTSLGRIMLVEYCKSSDPEYQALIQKGEGQLQDSESRALANKENYFSKLNDFFCWVEEQLSKFSGLFHSRTHEYEADVTGAYFAHRAEFNPLGAIYLQELLSQNSGSISEFFHKHFEFAFTHPYGENRKRALFAAVNEIAPDRLNGRVTYQIAKNIYDVKRLAAGEVYARNRA
jgi:Zn-dependent protease with chaperone function